MQQLRTRRYTQRQVAQGSGVPFSTICKIAQGAVKEPSVHTVQAMYDWFRAQTDTAEHATQAEADTAERATQADADIGFGEPRTGTDRRDVERRDLNDCPPDPCSFVGGFGESRTGLDPRDDDRRALTTVDA